MQMKTIEISVGIFVLSAILALVFLVVKVSGISLEQNSDSYVIKARFDDVSGLRDRSKVSMAGVTVGRVSRIEIDMEYGQAIISMEINDSPGNLTLDTGAQILTEGVLGARYISLLPGAENEFLQDGDFLMEGNTQSAFVLENLIGEVVTRLGGE
tara:strand:- start:121 stop:585 length:465 start_codon:yes stop_codon:yes gene_type:complete